MKPEAATVESCSSNFTPLATVAFLKIVRSRDDATLNKYLSARDKTQNRATAQQKQSDNF